MVAVNTLHFGASCDSPIFTSRLFRFACPPEQHAPRSRTRTTRKYQRAYRAAYESERLRPRYASRLYRQSGRNSPPNSSCQCWTTVIHLIPLQNINPHSGPPTKRSCQQLPFFSDRLTFDWTIRKILSADFFSLLRNDRQPKYQSD